MNGMRRFGATLGYGWTGMGWGGLARERVFFLLAGFFLLGWGGREVAGRYNEE